MNLFQLKQYFKKELSANYSESESLHLASIFITEKLGFNKIEQRLNEQKLLLETDLQYFEYIINELKTEKPYQQILGYADFFGLQFLVDENVLIPRPETEELLEIAISKIQKSKFKNIKFKVLDIGTGSGIIPIIIKKHFPNAEVFAIDISEKALEIAKKNAEKHKITIHFSQQDYLQTNLENQWDFIFSNPPYIGLNEDVEIERSVKDFEPNIALFSPTKDALIFYKKITKDAENRLNKGGMIFLEINQKLGTETLELFQKFNYKELIKDLSGNDRMIIVEQ